MKPLRCMQGDLVLVTGGRPELIGRMATCITFVGEYPLDDHLWQNVWHCIFENPIDLNDGSRTTAGLICDEALFPLRPDVQLYEEARQLSQQAPRRQ